MILLQQEIKSFRNAFEQLLASLANHDNDEANSLMVSALETVEMMNNALQLKDEVHFCLQSSFNIFSTFPHAFSVLSALWTHLEVLVICCSSQHGLRVVWTIAECALERL